MAPRKELSPVAVVDIGSNSVRLVVYEGATRAPTPLFNEKVLCGLGRSLTSTGRLGADAVARALRALRRFRALIDQMGVTRVEAIATAAAREAENGPDFIARAERVLEAPIKVLSGTEEAELAKLDWLEKGKDRDFYAIGGTWRALARLHMTQTNYPLNIMHNYRIELADALKFASLLDQQSQSSLAGIRDISSARRETIPYGALVLERLLRVVKPRAMVISVYGIREGLLYELLSEDERGKDPLIAACDDLARRRSRSIDSAYELCFWTDALFRGPNLAETPEQTRLRHAACLLSDIGWHAHPDYRGIQSLNLVAHGNFVGVDHPGRAFLALTVYFRNEGTIKDELNPSLIELVDKDMLKRARILGAAFRAAHMVSASMPGVLTNTPLTYEGNRLVWSLPEPYSNLDGERVDRRFKALASLLDRDAEIRVGPSFQRAAS